MLTAARALPCVLDLGAAAAAEQTEYGRIGRLSDLVLRTINHI